MTALEKALQLETDLHKSNNYNVRNLAPIARECGYKTAINYLKERDNYYFQKWIPKVVRPHLKEVKTFCEQAIKNKESQIIIPQENGLRVWEGDEPVDYKLCEELGIQVVNVSAGGGTIVGSEKDLSLMLIAPNNVGLKQKVILDKFVEILSKYLSDVVHSGNDILVDDKKVCGTTYHSLEDICVFTCQISFGDYTEYIEKLCTKKSDKKPAFINNNLLTKEILEEDILNWLLKK